MAHIFGQNFDDVWPMLSGFFYAFTVIYALAYYKDKSIYIVIIAFLGGVIPSLLIFGLQQGEYDLFSRILYIYFLSLFIFISFNDLRDYTYSFSKPKLAIPINIYESKLANIMPSMQRHKISIRKINLIYLFSSILIILIYIVTPMSSDYNLVLTSTSINLTNIPTAVLNNVTTVSSYPYSLFMKPTISLSSNNYSGINVTFDPQTIQLGSNSKIKIYVKDLANEGSNQIKIRSNFTIFKSLSCNAEVNTSFNITVPDIITLTCDKLSPMIAGTSINWTANVMCDPKRSLVFAFFDNNTASSPGQMRCNKRTCTWTWNTNISELGNHTIKVIVADKNDGSWKKTQSANFNIVPYLRPKVKSISHEGNSYTAIAEINLTYNKNIMYKFLTSEDNKTFQQSRNWSDNPNWVANPPLVQDKLYYLQVKIKDDRSNPEKPQQAWIGSNYTIPFYLQSEGSSDGDYTNSESSTPTPQVSTPIPQVPTPIPQVPTPTPQVSTPTPQVSTPTPQVSTPTPQVSTPTPQISTPTQQSNFMRNTRILISEIESKW